MPDLQETPPGTLRRQTRAQTGEEGGKGRPKEETDVAAPSVDPAIQIRNSSRLAPLPICGYGISAMRDAGSMGPAKHETNVRARVGAPIGDEEDAGFPLPRE